jgi:FemAB-related protein (PEP-CTERM system-associated)
MSVVVREAEAKDKKLWDSYVESHSEGTFCHRYGWKDVIEVGAGQQCPYLIAEREGKTVGVLPLSIRDSWLFGKASISSMFAVYGGAVADSGEIGKMLEDAAWKYTRSQDIPCLELRTVASSENNTEDWHLPEPTSATFLKAIGGSEGDLLLAVPRKQRAVVRKSLGAGLKCIWDKDLDTFYTLYAESVRNLGTPVFPKTLFKMFLAEFPDDIEIQIIKTSEGRPLASLMSFYHRGVVLPYYAGGTPEARNYAAHDFMYYQLMIRAVERGAHTFDFGRSKIGSGPYKFKKNWGFEPTPLHYRTRTDGNSMGVDLNPNSAKYRLLVKVWKKMPLFLANTFGPMLARHLG